MGHVVWGLFCGWVVGAVAWFAGGVAGLSRLWVCLGFRCVVVWGFVVWLVCNLAVPPRRATTVGCPYALSDGFNVDRHAPHIGHLLAQPSLHILRQTMGFPNGGPHGHPTAERYCQLLTGLRHPAHL